VKKPILSTPKESKASQVNIKSMLIIFSDCESIIHQESVPPGQMVNQHYYWEVLQCLMKQVCRIHPEWKRNQDWFIHHDNELAHTALSMQQFLAAKNMAVVPHPPYSPYSAPSDFFLLPRIKSQ
jgi:hypothetical protein